MKKRKLKIRSVWLLIRLIKLYQGSILPQDKCQILFSSMYAYIQ